MDDVLATEGKPADPTGHVDYVAWCGTVLAEVNSLIRSSIQMRESGVACRHLAMPLFGELVEETPRVLAIHNALLDLTAVGLLRERTTKQGAATHCFRLPSEYRELARNPVPVWEEIVHIPLDTDHEQVLASLNRLSAAQHGSYATAEYIDDVALLEGLGWIREKDWDRLWVATRDLVELKFADGRFHADDFRIRATYRGLVWETRRGVTIESGRIEALVALGETTSIELKREVETTTKDQKAELIKDLLGLANTQASPPHLLVIGFDDKTRSYYGPPSPNLTQDRLERLLSEYTTPPLRVRYRVLGCQVGEVGEIEVFRDRTQLPYRVARSFGNQKRIEMGSLFVRHGSQTVPATPDEERLIVEEGEMARSR